MKKPAWTVAVAALAAAGLLIGCGGGSDSAQTGRMSLAVTDAPVDSAEALYLTLATVTLEGIQGSHDQGPFDVPEERRLVNLMEYTGTGSAVLLTDLEVPVGTYKVRLDVDLSFTDEAQSSWIAFAAGSPQCPDPLPAGAVWGERQETCRYPLRIPSGEQSGFKPKGDVTVTAGGTSHFTVEFDLRRNVVDPQAASSIAYVLKPTGLRLVNDAAVGTITGAVDPTLLAACSNPADAKVYLYDRTGAIDSFVPDDMHPRNEALVTSVSVEEVTGATPATYLYLIGFVPEGTYALALTCDADNPELDEDLDFLAEVDGFEVGAGMETVQDLPAAP